MITQLANKVRNLVVTDLRITADRHQSEVITKVIEQLEKLRESLARMQFIYTALETRLGQNDALSLVREKCVLFDQRIQDMQLQFGQDRNQAQRLVKLNTDLNTVMGELDKIWYFYALKILNPLKQQFDLVKNLLPEKQRMSAQRLITELDKVTQNAPYTKIELTTFDNRLKQLQADLNEVEDMSSTVQEFLNKLGLSGGIRLSDIAPEALEYCQRHGDKFKIMFVQD